MSRKRPTSSVIQCPDGAVLNVVISEGRAQVSDTPIVLISMEADGRKLQTWMDEESASEARIAQVLYAAKHSPEFRDSLAVSTVEYPRCAALENLLSLLDKPAVIEVAGNLAKAPVHDERCFSLNFPDGLPSELSKQARKARWLSVSHVSGEHRLKVTAPYGHAHTLNHRLLEFLESYLASSLKRADFKSLDVQPVSTIVTLPAIKQPVVSVSDEQLKLKIAFITSQPLHRADAELVQLKSGRDKWSGLKGAELESHITGPESLASIKCAFKDASDRQTAYRWHLRGLPADYAIKKTQLDAERRSNYSMMSR